MGWPMSIIYLYRQYRPIWYVPIILCISTENNYILGNNELVVAALVSKSMADISQNQSTVPRNIPHTHTHTGNMQSPHRKSPLTLQSSYCKVAVLTASPPSSSVKQQRCVLQSVTQGLSNLLCCCVLNMLEHYMPQSSSSSSAETGGGRGGGGLYLDAYEVSFPLEENAERPPAYHLNHSQQMVEGGSSRLLWIRY